MLDEFKANLNKFDLLERVTIIQDDSKNIKQHLTSIDFIYIDGSHEYNDVLRDLKNAFRKRPKTTVLKWDLPTRNSTNFYLYFKY